MLRIDPECVRAPCTQRAVVEGARRVSSAVKVVGYASPFEKLFALALVCFQNAAVEWAVLETGLGGRWDTTNHCAPLACGLTRVGLDHANVLGGTVTEIAAEKGGILKASVPAFTVPQEPDAASSLAAAAGSVATSLRQIDCGELGGVQLPIWLAPHHQRLNAALAAAIVASLAHRGLVSDDGAARSAAIARTRWPARFEARISACGVRHTRIAPHEAYLNLLEAACSPA